MQKKSDSHSELQEEREEGSAQEFRPESVRKLFAEMFTQGWLLAGGLCLVFSGVGVTLIEPRLFGYAVDRAIVPRDWALLKTVVIAYLGLICVRVVSVMGQSYLFERLGQAVAQSLRVKLFAHLQAQPMSVFDKNPAGRLLTRVTNDVSSVSEMFSAGFVAMVSNFLLCFGILGWLLYLSPKLGLIAASTFPVLAVLSVIFSKKLRITYREARSKLSALNAFLAENILGMKVVHLFNRQKIHLERFDRVNQWYTDALIGTVRTFALLQPSITLASGISMALVVYYGGNEVTRGAIPIGILIAYFSYVQSFYQPLRELADKWSVFLSGLASAERIFSILEWKPELNEAEVSLPIVSKTLIRGEIRFENVWFAYDQDHWVLKDFSLTLEPGMKVGVVGHTGAGKTTLIQLLLRFYEPQKGRILLDGRNIQEIPRRELRSLFGVIQQEAFLFSGSVEENVFLWRNVSGEERGLYAGIADRIQSPSQRKGSRPKGLDERGSNISIGERQVIAFTRALMTSPQIWILDEATANIDSQTEQRIVHELSQSAKGKTQILIAHRLATVRDADQILVLHKGALIEQGNHSALLGLNGLYARLYRFQSAQDRLADGLQV